MKTTSKFLVIAISLFLLSACKTQSEVTTPPLGLPDEVPEVDIQEVVDDEEAEDIEQVEDVEGAEEEFDEAAVPEVNETSDPVAEEAEKGVTTDSDDLGSGGIATQSSENSDLQRIIESDDSGSCNDLPTFNLRRDCWVSFGMEPDAEYEAQFDIGDDVTKAPDYVPEPESNAEDFGPPVTTLDVTY